MVAPEGQAAGLLLCTAEQQHPVCGSSAEEASALCGASLRAVRSLEEGKRLHFESSISEMFCFTLVHFKIKFPFSN